MLRKLSLTMTAAAVAAVTFTAPLSPAAAHPYGDTDWHDHGHSTAKARWSPCDRIDFLVNLSQAKPGALADVHGAVRRVREQTGLTFRYVGTTTRTSAQPYPAGIELLIEWVRPGQGSLPNFGKYGPIGYGGWTSQSGYLASGKSAQRIVHGFVSIDSTKQTYINGFTPRSRTGTQGTRGQLLMHELGHAVGLNHTNHRADVMYPSMSNANAKWTSNDLAQLRRQGKAGGCLHSDDPMYQPNRPTPPTPTPTASPSSTATRS